MIPDGHGGGSADPFERYSVSPETVWRMGDDVAAFAGDIELLDTGVLGAHRPAQYGVAGMLEGPMLAAPEPVRQRAGDWMQAALFSGATIRLFGDAIKAYNDGIDDLNRRYWAAYNNSFGVADPVIAADATPAEQAAATSAHGDAVATARAASLNGLQAEHAALEAVLDAAAAECSDLLARGPGDHSAVLRLYQSGAMNLAAPYAFPGVNFGSIDPLKLFENMVNSGQFPGYVQSMSADQLFEWMQDHPEMANVAALLLMVPNPTPQQTTIVQALGRYDAWVTGQAMRGQPGSQALAAIAGGTQRMRDINARITGDRPMTDAEAEYLDAWFEELGADNLAGMYDFVEESVFGGASQADLGSAAGPMRDSVAGYLAPVANSIMNLSHVRDFNEMPQPVQDLILTRPGYVTGDQRYANDAWETRLAFEDMFDGIAGLDRYNGIANLLGTSTVDGSEDFTVVLAQSAFTVRQDLNLIVEQGFYVTDLYGEREEAIDLERLADDSGASTMLSVVGRNEDASAAVLTDDEMRPLLLGLNWDDATGAVSVLAGGTDRNPDGGGGGVAQGVAAQQVMLEIGNDRDGYLTVMSAPMKTAVVDMAVTWVDTFGRDPAPGGDTVRAGQDLLGNDAVQIYFGRQDSINNFLQFTAGVGDNDFVRLRAAAFDHSHDVLVGALASGDSSKVENAITSAGRLDGVLFEADFDYRYHEGMAEVERIQAAEAAAHNQAKGVATGLKVVQGVAVFGANAASGGSTSLVFAGATPVTNGWIDSVTSGIGQPEFTSAEAAAREGREADSLRTEIAAMTPGRRDYFLVNAYHSANLVRDGHESAADVFNADGTLRPYDTIHDVGQLRAVRHNAGLEWENTTPGNGRIEIGLYDSAFNSAAPTDAATYEAVDPTWSDEDRRKELGYGGNVDVVSYDAHALDDPGGPPED